MDYTCDAQGEEKEPCQAPHSSVNKSGQFDQKNASNFNSEVRKKIGLLTHTELPWVSSSIHVREMAHQMGESGR
jgi:hypothetical protein